MSWLHGARARLRLLFNRRAAESRIDAELAFHIQMETERLVREQQLNPVEARRRARVSFGGVQQHRETLRDGRGLAWLSAVSIDAKLGARMLVKYPGLTIVGLLGISVAVAVGVIAFTGVRAVTSATLPFEGGDRVVRVQSTDVRAQRDANSFQLHRLAEWRATLRTLDDISVSRQIQRNVGVGDGIPSAETVAEISESGLRLARTAPVLGRILRVEDEQVGAIPVVVIGYDFWQQKFGGRDDVVGSAIKIGAVVHTIVGVMPKGFAFPQNNRVWVPFTVRPSSFAVGQAPEVQVFGRLANTVSISDAQRELDLVTDRMRAADTLQRDVRSELVPFAQIIATQATIDGFKIGSLLHTVQILVLLLLSIIAINVAVLVYARTASRTMEMTVRTALGASRARIVGQLFTEALVLSGISAIVGIAVAYFALRRVDALIHLSLAQWIPYWIRFELRPEVMAYAFGLAVVAALVIGAVPGLKATNRNVSENLKQSSGHSMQLGRTWTALLIAQVAVSVSVMPLALAGATGLVSSLVDRSTLATRTTVITSPQNDDRGLPPLSADESRARLLQYSSSVAAVANELRLAGIDAALMSARPGNELWQGVEIETPFVPVVRNNSPGAFNTVSDTGTGIKSKGSAGRIQVSEEFFSTFDMRLLAGRMFQRGDFDTASTAIVVNKGFAKYYFGETSALGRRVRNRYDSLKAAPDPWWEIVGVVDESPGLQTQQAVFDDADLRPKIYFPLQPTKVYPIVLAARGRTQSVPAVSDRIRTIAARVDPSMRFTSVRTLQSHLDEAMETDQLAILSVVSVTMCVVLLSVAGIYALMSFTVNKRRREVGIRGALGASSRQILSGILSRALRHVAIGIVIGAIGAAVLSRVLGDSASTRDLVHDVLIVVGTMVGISLVATIEPARRALRVQPTEALRME